MPSVEVKRIKYPSGRSRYFIEDKEVTQEDYNDAHFWKVQSSMHTYMTDSTIVHTSTLSDN